MSQFKQERVFSTGEARFAPAIMSIRFHAAITDYTARCGLRRKNVTNW
ncbi:hypothetical protein HC928_11175 [bacterium]|nr:hypothetical protein [bacterium]